MHVPYDMVEQYYSMNPTTEDLLRGEDLKEGMVVLMESPFFRQDLGQMQHTNEVRAAQKRNRWCIITRLKIDEERGQIWFIGLYADGSKMSRNDNINSGWLVKLDSIPQTLELTELKPGDELVFDMENES